MIQKRISQVLKERFGCKVYKLSLDGGMTCPNRDGTVGDGGCIFCGDAGSGEFAEKPCGSIAAQLERAKSRVAKKVKEGKYIAYFQSFTNTYAPLPYLERIYKEAIAPDDVVGLAIATRPDCLGDEVIDLLKKINQIKPLWVELGLQTINEKTAEDIRRGYKNEVFDRAVKRLQAAGIETVAHMIIGLPGETAEDAINTARHLSDLGIDGIKFHMLYVVRGTDLENDYLSGKFKTLSLDEYTEILKGCISVLKEDIVVHRLTGDGAKKDLVAPLWSGNKKKVLNHINKELGGL
ncbi:MAG: TIGR01212 family radical SAM protein [Acutalibacteraceae bacterium]|nr:TIGR01212 family radical SAM protein [Acutalibacteraceae bacterium]